LPATGRKLRLIDNRISIPLIYAIASKTKLLDADPMLWFSMMLMPTGPPAMILVALADVTGAAESMKMTVAKFLTVRNHQILSAGSIH